MDQQTTWTGKAHHERKSNAMGLLSVAGGGCVFGRIMLARISMANVMSELDRIFQTVFTNASGDAFHRARAAARACALHARRSAFAEMSVAITLMVKPSFPALHARLQEGIKRIA